MKTLIILSCCALGVVAIGLGRKQSSGARGILTCNGTPMSGVLIKLYDDDRGVDADDFMAETNSQSDGHFEISGYSHEFTTIDPKINIYHDCEDGLTPCQRKISIMIPDKYKLYANQPGKGS